LAFIDGIRGLAALYVVLHHAYFQVVFSPGALSPTVLRLTRWMADGTFAVDVFIVLSGFCLMLPLLRGPDRGLAGGVGGFMRRRARRILPAYYAALGMCLVAIAMVPGLRERPGNSWSHSLPVFTRGVLLSHLLLVHNLSIRWIWKIDSPAWSVATEWQIYFFFALVLVPIWRRFGMPLAVATAFAAGNLVEASMPASNEACFYFTGFFGLGMAAAALYDAPKTARWLPWNWIASALAGIVALAMFVYPGWTHRPKIEVDLFVGFTAAVGLVALSRGSLEGGRSLILRVLESRLAVGLGRFSYSLYLIHYPVIAWTHLWLQTWHLNGGMDLALMLLICVPLAVGVSYGFHVVFERPFLVGAADSRAIRVPAFHEQQSTFANPAAAA
jgi:peptidoglycan/LPS O-acetylase OafA/YrhL